MIFLPVDYMLIFFFNHLVFNLNKQGKTLDFNMYLSGWVNNIKAKLYKSQNVKHYLSISHYLVWEWEGEG